MNGGIKLDCLHYAAWLCYFTNLVFNVITLSSVKLIFTIQYLCDNLWLTTFEAILIMLFACLWARPKTELIIFPLALIEDMTIVQGYIVNISHKRTRVHGAVKHLSRPLYLDYSIYYWHQGYTLCQVLALVLHRKPCTYDNCWYLCQMQGSSLLC